MTEVNRWLGERAPCWICAVVAGTVKAFVVIETPHVLALVSPIPLNPGHALIVPRQHIRDVYTLPEELGGRVFAAASRVARLKSGA